MIKAIGVEERELGDTIVAVSTAPGRGGIGIVRVSGPEALAVAARVVTLPLDDETPHALAQVTRVRAPGGEGAMDEAVVTVFRAPRSYTGEMLVEIAAHGSPVVLEAMVRMALGGASGAKASASLGGVMPGRPKAEALGYQPGPTQKPEQQQEQQQVPFGNGKQERQGQKQQQKQVPCGNDKQERQEQQQGHRQEQRQQQEAGPSATPQDDKINQVRLAEPGEFTRRAFLSGRIDLTQAEAVGDLIAAQTLDQARVAAQQMGGAMSRRVRPAKEALLHLIALLEAGMDFASGELDDVDVVAPAAIAAAIAEARGPLAALAAGFARGQMLRRGAAIAIVGRPNAGKSSLFNRLLKRERAIVTAVAGTTRDTVEESVAVGGVPVRLIDTAGLRVGAEGVDEAEALGIARSREALADADLVLVVEDVTAHLYIERKSQDVIDRKSQDVIEADFWEMLAGRPHLRVRNKVDLLAGGAAGDGIGTSAVTGEGIEALRAAIVRELGAEGAVADAGAIHTLRQQEAVRAAVAALDAAEEANAAGQPHEIVLMELHAALGAMDSLTGTTTTEDILGRIFAAFCIGK